MLDLDVITVGALQEHCYILTDAAHGQCIVVDPGAEAERILGMIDGKTVQAIVLTHAHHDHIGAVGDLRAATAAPVYIHPADAHMLGSVLPDKFVQHGGTLSLGSYTLSVTHTPGHTPGMLTFMLDDGRAIVGDTVFAGGPGRTWSPDDFQTTLHTLQNVVLGWPDVTVCYPGHGPSFRLGDVRNAITAFVQRDHPADFYGDAAW